MPSQRVDATLNAFTHDFNIAKIIHWNEYGVTLQGPVSFNGDSETHEFRRPIENAFDLAYDHDISLKTSRYFRLWDGDGLNTIATRAIAAFGGEYPTVDRPIAFALDEDDLHFGNAGTDPLSVAGIGAFETRHGGSARVVVKKLRNIMAIAIFFMKRNYRWFCRRLFLRNIEYGVKYDA